MSEIPALGGPEHRSTGRSAIEENAIETVGVSRPSGGQPEPTGPVSSRYAVLEEVGRGGMGSVVRAYDPKLQREVALKQLHRGMLGTEGVAQLVAEARAMAKLSHPNVVAVYDVEESGGQVVLVMEYVPGTTLREWLAGGQPDWTEVVARFIAAGQGLAAAHEAGLLHRDFKPANVLANENVTKVTDFGLAKGVGEGEHSRMPSVDGASGEQTVSGPGLPCRSSHSRESRIMGTPRYMAPEQHEGGTLTNATDQYAFCVALWEALCGEPPFTGPELGRHKREGPPGWTRSAVPRPIADALRRGLAPDPRMRWPSMGALLEALAYDPVRRRNRWLLALSASGVGVLGLTSWGAFSHAKGQRCAGAREHLAGVWDASARGDAEAAMVGTGAVYAQGVWEQTSRQLDEYTEEWIVMHTEACEATALREDQSEAVMDLRMGCLHRAKTELDAVVGVLATADESVLRKAHEVVAELVPLSQCADIETLQAEVEPPPASQAGAVDTARAWLAEAKAQGNAGRYDSAQAKVDAAREALREVTYEPVLAEFSFSEGNILVDRGEYAAAEASLERALELAVRSKQWGVAKGALLRLMNVVGVELHQADAALRYLPLARALLVDDADAARLGAPLAGILHRQGKYAEAEQEIRRARALWEKTPRAKRWDGVSFDNNLAIVLFAQGKYAESESAFRRALESTVDTLGSQHPDVAGARNNLANLMFAQGKYAEAESEYRQAVELRERVLGPSHPDTAKSRSNLANVLHTLGKYADAEEQQRRALDDRVKSLGPEHPDVAESRNNLAAMLRAQGKYAESESEHRLALQLRTKALGPEHLDVAQSRVNLANVLHDQGKYEEAEAEHRRARALMLQTLGPNHPDVAKSFNNLAVTLRDRGKYAEAEAEYRQSLEVTSKALDPNHPEVAITRAHLTAVLLELGKTDEALSTAEQAWESLHDREDVSPSVRAHARFVLARALWRARSDAPSRRRAREQAEQAAEFYRTAAPLESEALEDVQTWLVDHRAG